MGSSRVPSLIDYLVSKFQASAQLGQANPPVTVFDGPRTTAESPFLVLYVGLQDPDNEAIGTAASFTQARADMGSGTRTEDTVIHCVAEAWTGADTASTISDMRHAVFAIVAAVEALVRAETGPQAFAGLGYNNPGVTAGDLLQNNTAAGAIARVPFTITLKSFT